jgi:hypothetical protein
MANETQPITAAQAAELAQDFHDLAVAIGQYRLENVADLTDAQQSQLQNQQWQCIQFSNSFIAASLFAAQADLAATLQKIRQATKEAQLTLKVIDDIDKALQIATAAAVLGASIASMNPSAVASGIGGLITAITGASSSGSSSSSGGS